MNDKELLSLEEMWEEAEARFNKRTGTPLHLKSVTWNQCVQDIKKMCDSDNSSTPNDRLEMAKESGIKMVHCLRLVGGVAAKAGSSVFGPSEMCFNALGVLLDIALKIRDFHKTVATMFEALGPALSVYEIYKDKDKFDNVHPAVNRAVHDIMISFVDVCGLYQSLHWNKSRAKRFWTDFKAAILDDDSGVGNEMERFKTLTQVHRDVQATQTLNEVLETNDLVANMLLQFTGVQHDVSILRNSDEERTLQKRHQQHLKVIKDKLGWNESASKQSEATPKKKLDNIPDGTAKWFRAEEQFLAWAKGKLVVDTQFRPLFVLGGPQDTGKSVLMSAILRHLQTTPPTDSSLRNLVTGYFFPPPSDTKDEDRHPVRTALKCIAVQLAEQDSAFARSLRQRCDDEADIDKVLRDGTYHQLWAFLGIGTPKESTAHYIIIDGFASLSKEKEREEQMNQLFGILGTQLGSDGRVRVAISVRSNMMSLIPDHTTRNSFVVDIVQKSAKDIQKVINHQFKENDLFQDEGDREREDLVDQIAAKVQGDFSKIDTVVEQVDKLVDSCESMEDIKQAFRSSGGKSTTSSDAISRLETELGAKEIDELQELLRWTMFGQQRYWSLDELNGALWLKLGTANTRKTKKKLAAKGKYSDIFTLDEDEDVQIKEDMRELLRRTERQLGIDRTPKITASFQITKGDVQSVQSFCWSLSQQVAQLTFNFDQAALAAGNVRKSFQLHEIDATISMLRSTFKILGAKPNARTQQLGRYAIAYLPQHLKSLGDVDQLERQERAEIAMGLYRIFVSGDVVDTHWNIIDNPNLWWHRDLSEIETIRECICKQSILDNLGIKDQEWLRQVQQAQDPNRTLLRPIMEQVAWRWLRDTDRPADRLFSWIHGHITMDPSEVSRETKDSDAVANAIETAAEWCKDAFSFEEGDFIWFRRLGETFGLSGLPRQGIEAFHKAIGKHDPDAKLLLDLAECYSEEKQYDAACEQMNQAKDLLEQEESPDRVNLGRVCYKLGLWYSRLGDLDADIHNTKKAIEWDNNNHEAQLHLLSTYLDNRLNDDTLEFVRGRLDIPNGMSQILVHMMEESETDSMFIKLFSLMRGHPERNILLHELNALQDGASGEAMDRVRLCSGIVSYYFCEDDPEARNTAIKLWKQSCSGLWRTECVSLITAHHFEQARTSKEPLNQEVHVDGMKSMADLMVTETAVALSHIATYHALNKDTASSRESLRPCVHEAFGLLTDDYDNNDDDGFWLLATAFSHCGDDLNALSAFCCLAPEHLQDADGDIMDWLLESSRDDEAFRCLAKALIAAAQRLEDGEVEQDQTDLALEDIVRQSAAAAVGEDTNLPLPQPSEDQKVVDRREILRKAFSRLRSSATHSLWSMTCCACDAIWDFGNDFYRCKYCRNMSLCQRCYDSLDEEDLSWSMKDVENLACHKDHDWLFVPKWTREAYMASLAGKVMAGGRMDNKLRVCGELVLVSDWLNAMKNEWGWKTEDVSDEEE